MRSIRTDPRPWKRGGALLTLFVHLDAARYNPRAYLTALWWRLRGKRLRARAQFAPLLDTSPRAYRLWLLSEEQLEPEGHVGNGTPTITALIDVRSGQGHLDKTLRSLAAEGIMALAIGTPEIPTFTEAAEKIGWAEDLWLMPLSAGDVLAPGTANVYRRAAVETSAGIVYADDDLLDKDDQRIRPHFKPQWNSELFRHFDYLTGSCILRASLKEVTDLTSSDWAASLVALASKAGEPIHIPHVLHHRHVRPRPRDLVTLDVHSVDLPSVTVIIPIRNRLDLLWNCLKGLEQTNYPDFEVIIVDNNSDDPATLAYLAELDPDRYRVLRHSGSFNFSAINNQAAEQARGQLLCLLNNDVEIFEPNWLAIMVTQALRPDVGAVGARLLYPDGRIQHAGVVLGVGGAAAHAHRLLHPNEEGYFRRHAVPQFVSAVTAACLVIARERFLAVGGLDEKNFAVAFNDVDLCMRLNQRGWQSFYEPRATLIHHESLSRGFDRDPVGAARFASELAALRELWGTSDQVDPFHHPELSPFCERFAIRL